MKLAKLLIALGGGLLVLVVLVVVIAFISIDKIAKAGIEKGTNYALAVPTSLESADVGVFDGTFKMQGLKIDNPEGYDSSPFFFNLGSGSVAVSLGSLRSDVVTLPEFKLSDIDVHIDRKGTTSNVHQILDNLKRFESGEPAEPGEPKTEKEAGKKFIVNEIAIKNVQVHAHLLPLGGEVSTTKLVIPEIILKDVGTAGDPVSLAEITNIVMQAILESAAQNNLLPEEILNDLRSNLDGLNALAENGVEMLTTELDKAAEDVQDQLQEKADELQDKAKDAINDGLNNLLGGNKDKKKEGDNGGG
ncbi:MAG: hypothetical protein KDA31_09080 [Phycisphaerales bacterium]|nr:hypothetical protein [Phycisphaerales bacterium]